MYNSPMPTSATRYVIRLTLQGVEHPIWRALLIPSDATLDLLHAAIVRAMPWEDTHIHVFEIGKSRISDPRFEISSGPEGDESMFTVGDVLPHVGSRITYVYDLSDDWRHDLEVREIREDEEQAFVCLGGEGAGPPEDCGGPMGFPDLLRALAHPNHIDHEEKTAWLRDRREHLAQYDERFVGEYDPREFDPMAVTRALSDLRLEYETDEV